MTVLVATDFSEASDNAVRFAAILAAAREERLTMLHCVEEGAEGFFLADVPSEADAFFERRREKAESAMRTVVERVTDVGADEVDYLVDFQQASEGILEMSRSGDYDLIVLGPTGRGGFAGLLFGSTAEKVVRNTSIPAVVVPPAWEARSIDTILVPVDFSDFSLASVDFAARLRREHGSEIVMFHHYFVQTPFFSEPEEISDVIARRRAESDDSLREIAAESGLDDVEVLCEGTVVEETVARSTDQAIVDAASKVGADAIVMGTRGHSALERLMIGATTFKVVRRAPVPVFLLRRE
jgi:nucleotide-binding universal stress UspA family protein